MLGYPSLTTLREHPMPADLLVGILFKLSHCFKRCLSCSSGQPPQQA